MCLTHRGDAYLDGLVALALQQWGEDSAISDCGYGDDIISTVTSTGHVGTATLSHDGTNIFQCEIEIRDIFIQPNTNVAQTVVHEVGHCLGLAHPKEREISVMSTSSWGYTEYDRESISNLYPKKIYKVIAIGLTKN